MTSTFLQGMFILMALQLIVHASISNASIYIFVLYILSATYFRLKENLLNITVDTIVASDLDSGYRGEVYYSLIDGDTFGDFMLEEINSTGK